jgi:hypothetical protein
MNGPSCNSTAAINAGLCLPAAHADTFEGGDGQEYLLYPIGTVGSTGLIGYSYEAALRFNACTNGDCGLMTIDVEAGGGAVETFNICDNGNCGDVHQGCAVKAPICVIGTDADSSLGEYDITNAVTSAGNVNLTLVGTPSFSTGATVMVGGVNGNGTSSGCVHANGAWVNVTVSGRTVTLKGVTCDGAWVTPGVGAGITNAAVLADPGHQDELMLLDFTNIGTKNFTVKRLAKSRAVTQPQAVDQYITQNHPTISMDGSLVVFGANNNKPYSVGVYSVATGYRPAAHGPAR